MKPILSRDQIFELATCPSTNDEVFHRLETRTACIVWTLDQTQGRGSRGRNWITPVNRGLAVSIGVRGSQVPHPAEFCFPLFAGTALYDCLNVLMPEQVLALKWPNDLLLDGKKLAGILCESRWVKNTVRIAIGIGINLRDHEQLTSLPKGYATLEQVSYPPTPQTIVQTLCEIANRHLQDPPKAYELNHRWLEKSYLKPGDRVEVTAYGERFHGAFTGLDEAGGLLIATSAGIRSIRQTCEDFQILSTRHHRLSSGG